tara:strand:- start:4997 stop:6520 length:1524 start_codon:yes stop_codon:yes gene_type:complete
VLSSTASPTEAWFSSQDPKATLLKSPLTNDAFDRWYLFEEGQPVQVMTFTDIDNGTGPWDLNFTQPTTAPSCVPTVITPADVETRVYVYTYVTSWGEESAPSLPTTVDVDEAGSVVVSGFYVPAPTIAGRTFDKVRIYRTVTGNASTAFFFLGEVTSPVDTFNDNISSSITTLNETLGSVDNVPSEDGLYGARVHPSGALVAFTGRDIYFSVPYLPHAWPGEYNISLADEIVGIEVFEQNIAVMTKGSPVLLYGAHPAAIGILRFSFPEPCIAYGSIVGAPEGAYYASHQGLVLFTAVGPTNITRQMISQEEWQNDYATDTMSSARWGTQYVSLETNNQGFIIDPQEARIALTDIKGSNNIVAVSSDIYTGDVYVVGGDDVFLWDDRTAPEVDYIWKSKQVVLPTPVNHGAVMVHLEPNATEYFPTTPVTTPPFPSEYLSLSMDKKTEVLVEIWCNDARIFVGKCGDREQVRVPSGKKGDAWEVRITGQVRVYSINITEVGRGLARV